MKTESINSINFQAKFFPKSICKNAGDLKNLMRQETIILTGRDINQTISTRGVSIENGKATFKDGKFLARRNKENKLVPYGACTSMIEYEKVRVIFKDDGEIIEHNKPFFKAWEAIVQEIDMFIKQALANYNDPNVVLKLSNKKETLTENGKKQAQKLMSIFDSINPFGRK